MILYYIDFHSLKVGQTTEFILPPLMSAIGLYIASAGIQTLSEKIEGICQYTAIAAFPSTGKSSAMETVKTAFSNVESYFQVEDNNSQIAVAPTVESLLDLLNHLKHCIGKII